MAYQWFYKSVCVMMYVPDNKLIINDDGRICNRWSNNNIVMDCKKKDVTNLWHPNSGFLITQLNLLE